jgi:hypothetical protein
MKYLVLAKTELGKKALAQNREDYMKLPLFAKAQKKMMGYVETYSIEPGTTQPKALMIEVNKRIDAIMNKDDFYVQVDKMMFSNGASKKDYSIEEVKE